MENGRGCTDKVFQLSSSSRGKKGKERQKTKVWEKNGKEKN